jgi:hypothetical protein
LPYCDLINSRELTEFSNSNELVLFFAKKFPDGLNEILRSAALTPGKNLDVLGMNYGPLWYDLFEQHDTLYESLSYIKVNILTG